MSLFYHGVVGFGLPQNTFSIKSGFTRRQYSTVWRGLVVLAGGWFEEAQPLSLSAMLK